ncbi:glycosyltransferase 87 family protein [Amycolatopsis sp. NPDC051903]|uniref:glycosyltransferase 87 family protein n=1 Tax=Amycolatopsis sp. NPDC051903 TaxID=3363936 RepID=UPI0037BD15A9
MSLADLRPRWGPVLLGEAVVVALVLALRHYPGLDLEVYLGGAKTLLTDQPLYGTPLATSQHISLPFLYPPFAAALFLPATVLPFAVTMNVLTVVSVLAVGVTAYFVVRSLTGRPQAALPAAYGAQLAGIVLDPIWRTLSFGQVNILLMALVVVDALAPGRTRTRGLLTGLAAAVKLTPLLFVLFFVLTKDFRAAVRTVAGFAVVSALTWLVTPATSASYWTEHVFKIDASVGTEYVSNQSLRGFLERLGVDGQAWWFAGVVVLLALTALAIRRVRHPALAVVVCAVGGLLMSPISWTHHWTWCVPILLACGCVGVRAWNADRALAWWAFASGAIGAALFTVAPMWFDPSPDHNGSGGWWRFATESFELYGLALLVLAAASTRVARLFEAGFPFPAPEKHPFPSPSGEHLPN